MLLHSDGFDSHKTGAAVLADGNPTFGAQVGVTIDATAGRFGGKSLTLAASTTGSAALTTGGTGVPISFAGWFKVGALTNPLVLVKDSAGALVTLRADRKIEMRDGTGVLRLTTTGAVLPANTYAWLEFAYITGGMRIFANGVQTDQYFGTMSYPASNVTLLNAVNTDAAGRVDIDDFIVWNNQTSFFTTQGIAPRRIQLLQADANGASSAWVPASGSNFAAVTAADWDGGVGVSATNIGQKDRYGFAPLATTPGSIDSVTLRVKAISTGSDPATLALLAAQGGTEVAATAQAVPLTAKPLQAIFYRDTANLAWTETSVNAAEFGMTLGA